MNKEKDVLNLLEKARRSLLGAEILEGSFGIRVYALS